MATSASSPYVRSRRARERRERMPSETVRRTRYVRLVLDVNDVNQLDPVIRQRERWESRWRLASHVLATPATRWTSRRRRRRLPPLPSGLQRSARIASAVLATVCVASFLVAPLTFPSTRDRTSVVSVVHLQRVNTSKPPSHVDHM